MAERGGKVDGRALGYALAVAIGMFLSLSAASYARIEVNAAGVDQVEPFTSWFPDNAVAAFVLVAVIACALGLAAYAFFTRFDRIAEKLGAWQGWHRMPLSFNGRSVILCSIAIFVLWLPIICLMYPGILTVDTFDQLYEYQTTAPTLYATSGILVDAEMIDHHPWFDTLLYGWFWQMGYALGSQELGIFIYAVVQCIVLAGCLGASVCYLERLKVPYALRMAALVFCALFPFIPHYAVTILKDSTQLMFFLPWLMLWLEAARTRGAMLDRKGPYVAFFLLGGMCILTKKTGLMMVAACVLILFVVMRGRRMKVALGGIACLVVFSVALPAAASAAVGGIAPGGRQEALGPAFQQITALIREDPSALTDEEMEAVAAVLDVDSAVSRFESFRADGAKNQFIPDASNEDVGRFMGVWLAAGLRHPDVYLHATATTTGMLYIPFMKLTSFAEGGYTGRAWQYSGLGTGFAVEMGRPEGLQDAVHWLMHESPESAFSDLPVISLFFTTGFYGGWIPFLSVASILYARKRRRKTGPQDDKNARERGPGGRPMFLVGIAPVIVLFALLFICPVASPRYILPFLFGCPLILGWVWFALSSRSETASR